VNDLAVIKIQKDCFFLCQQWVSAGLSVYQASLDQAATAEQPANDHSDHTTDSASEFYSLSKQLKDNQDALNGRTAKLMRLLNLTPPQLYLVMLAGLSETQPRITFTLSELQHPDPTGHLSIHLALDIIQTLFPETGVWDVMDITHSVLVDSGLLRITGEGPLPLKSLQIPLPLWAVLKNHSGDWPETQPITFIERDLLPAETRKSLPLLSHQLNNADFFILRGQLQSGRGGLAAEMARLNGLTAIEVPFNAWQEQSCLRLACAIAGWLPVVRLADLPGERYQPVKGPDGLPLVVLAGPVTTVVAARSIEYQMPLPCEKVRFNIWSQWIADETSARKLAGSALLSGPVINDLCHKAKSASLKDGIDEHLIRQLRARNNDPRLSQLAIPVLRHVPDTAVVFPPLIRDYLNDLIRRTEQRESVWSTLGDSLSASRNPGLRALFVGESGTGKTLAASYIASQTGAPLYRVDLCSVMNKYIGESEKNLGNLLDFAAATDAILLFDEADSVFGNRTDARSGGERFANNLTNYLLARIESHPGIVILTTNHRDRIDPAFNRRLEVIIDFPQPGFTERLGLWQSHIGNRSPDENFLRALASHCDLSGGQIRNAVLSAAANSPGSAAVSEAALINAVSREYQKLGRALPAALHSYQTQQIPDGHGE